MVKVYLKSSWAQPASSGNSRHPRHTWEELHELQIPGVHRKLVQVKPMNEEDKVDEVLMAENF